MIVIKVELHSARTGKVSQLGEMHICNDGTSTDPAIGNYESRVMRKPDFRTVTRHGKVSHWRRNDKTIWHLIGALLTNMGYSRGG